MCCGDMFCAGIHKLLTVIEDIDIYRTFTWLPWCDTEYFHGTAKCPLVMRKLCAVACWNSSTCHCLTSQIVGLSGEICSAISRPYFLLSLTEASHVVWCGAPLEMNGGAKTGLKYKRSCRLTCDRRRSRQPHP
jgi:hypothetical protein